LWNGLKMQQFYRVVESRGKGDVYLSIVPNFSNFKFSGGSQVRKLGKMMARLFSLLQLISIVSGNFHLDVHLKQKNLAELETRFWQIATPKSVHYLNFLRVSDVANLIGSHDDDISSVTSWLQETGAISVSTSLLRDTISAHFADENFLLLTNAGIPHPKTHPPAVEFIVRRDLNSNNAKVHPVDHRALVQSSSDWVESLSKSKSKSNDYTVDKIKAAYGMPNDLQATNDDTLQMVWGPGTFGYSKVALEKQKNTEAPLINMDKIIFDTANEGEEGGDNFMEGQLDVNMVSSFGLNVTTLVSNTNTTASTEESTGFGAALLQFLTQLANRETLPHVLSMSLGSLSGASCDLLCSEAVKAGHTMDECTSYMTTQRQVCMFLDEVQTDRINTALQILGARGVTVLGSSGDGGSHFSFGPFEGEGDDKAMADTLNEISCKFQIPVFPTASPYVVSIGGEMWDGGDSTKPITWAGYGGGSGGGFSIQFDAPNHQKVTVAAYLKKDGMPPAESFDAGKRAYPDISAVGVSGTSQSCPITAGIFSMLIDMRLNSGLGGLGFVAPRIWEVAERFPGEAFEDIVGGNSCCVQDGGDCTCGEESGFPALEGWDANTGWGRPIWDGLVEHFTKDIKIKNV